MRPSRLVSFLVALAVLTAGCTSSSGQSTEQEAAEPAADAGVQIEILPTVDLAIRAGPGHVTIDEVPDGLAPGAQLELTDDQGRPGSLVTIADNRSALFRGIDAGRVRLFVVEDGERTAEAEAFAVPGPAPPPDLDY